MKQYVVIATIALSGCMAPEELVEYAREECNMIGYDIQRERVPTLQCVERGYRSGKAAQRFPVGTVLNAASLGVIAAQ